MSTHPTEVPPVLDSVADLDAAWVETVLRAGDCAGFKAGVPNGH